MDAAALRVVVTADTSKAEAGLNNFSSKLQGTARNLGGISAGMSLGITAPIVAASVAAFNVGKDFESAFTGVIKTFSGTAAEAAVLRQGIRDMSMELPASAVEIATVAEAAGALGIQKENIMGFTRTIIDMGEATDLTAEQAANDMARIANIMGMPQDQFDRMGSTIVALGNAGASTESEIVSMAMRISGAGSVIGLSEAQVLGWSSAMSSVGINAEAGGTAFSRVVVDMAKEVATGGKNLNKFAKVAGVSSAAFVKAFEEDASAATLMFIEGLGGIADAGGNVFGVLEELGLADVRVQDTLLRLAGAQDLVTDSLKTADRAWEENIALTREAELRYATTDSKMAMMKNRIKDVGITLFDTFKPAINAGIDGVSDFALGLGDAIQGFAAANPALVSAAAAFAGVLAVAGPLVGIAAGVAFALSALGTAAAPILLVTAAVAGLAAAFAGNFLGIRDAVMGVVEAVRPHFETLLGWISSAAQGDFGPLKAGLQGALTSVSTAIAEFKWSDFVTKMGEWGTYITTVVWPDFISTLADWSTFVSNIVWSAYITSLSWDTWIDDFLWDTYVFLLTWDSYVTNLDWTGFVTALIDWGTWIPAIVWNSFVAVIDWATYVGALVWSEWLSKIVWGDYVAAFDGWGTYLSTLTWTDVITALTDWGTWIASVTWSDFITPLTDWATAIGTVTWSSFIEKIEWPQIVTAPNWPDFIEKKTWPDEPPQPIVPDLVWADVINFSVDWASKIPALDWKSIVTAPIDWITAVPALPWTAFVTVLDWTAFISFLTWDAWLNPLNWGEQVGELELTEKVDPLNWDDFVTAVVLDVAVPILDWHAFVTSTTLDSFIDRLEWGNFIKKLEWPSPAEILSAVVDAIRGVGMPEFTQSRRENEPFPDQILPQDGRSGGGSSGFGLKAELDLTGARARAIAEFGSMAPIEVPMTPGVITITQKIPPLEVSVTPQWGTMAEMAAPFMKTPIAVPIQLERITEQDMAGVIESSTKPLTVTVTPKIEWPTGGQMADILRPLGGGADQKMSVRVEATSITAAAGLTLDQVTAMIGEVKPPAVMPVIQVKGEMINDLSQAGAGVAAAAAQGAAALSSSLSGFRWPPIVFEWPLMPIFSWPGYNPWTWPPIPRPTWIDSMVVPRPNWLGELLAWSPTVVVTSSGAPTTPGQIAGSAAGTNYWRGGATWVGEEGPEILIPPKGSRILSNRDSMAAAGGGGNVTVEFTGPITITNDMDLNTLADKLVYLITQKQNRRG